MRIFEEKLKNGYTVLQPELIYKEFLNYLATNNNIVK